MFLSGSAIWIIDAVKEQMPTWTHIADSWHACQHLFKAREDLCGKDTSRGRAWGRYWSKRLRRLGAGVVEERLRKLSLFYRDLSQQRVVLDLGRFLAKHGSRMEYPAYEGAGWTISSGPMESLGKQIGLRMKGPGMRWSEANVSPMGSLVSWWSLDAENCELFGAVPRAN